MRPDDNIPSPTIPSPPGSGSSHGVSSVGEPTEEPRDTLRAERELARVREVGEPLCASHGLELVEVAWSNDRGGRILKVTIDRPLPSHGLGSHQLGHQLASHRLASHGLGDPSPRDVDAPPAPFAEAVTLEDCVQVSRDLSTALDVEEIIEQSYSLEVSSPGLDRPLRNERDFRRQQGRLAKVKLREPASDGQRVLRGIILESDSSGVSMEVDGNLHRVPFDNITEARLVFELGAQPKKGGSGSSGKRPKSRKR